MGLKFIYLFFFLKTIKIFRWEIECIFNQSTKTLEKINLNAFIDEENIINNDINSRNWILNLFKIMKNEIK